MTNKINDETLERLYEDVVADDDRDEILQFIAENEFYKQFT